MQNSEAAEHLRDVLSKPPPKTPTHPRVPPSKTVATSDQGARAPSSTTPFPKRTLTSLEYPTVDVPGASPKPAPVATPSSSPPSIFGKGVFGSPAAPSGLTPKKSPAKNHGGGFLKFSRGRSALDANEDEFGGHNDTATTLEREQPSSRPSRATPTRLFSGTNPPSVGGAPKVLPGLASIFHSGSPAKNAGGNALLQSSTRDSLSLKDGDFEHRKYIATRPKKSALAATDTPSPHLETKHKRAVSWVDQVANGHISAPSPSSDLDLKIEQAAHGSNDARPPPLHRAADTDSESTGSTVSLNSPFASKVSVVLTTPAPQATKVSQLLRDSTLAASRNLSTFKGTSMWDPDDDEWADVDASRIVETFKASFKDPGQYSPRKASALSGWGSTITSFLPSSPTKRAESQKLREEENLRDKLDMLQNTYYSDPDGDLCDTVMKGVHLTGGAYFEATTSARKAHVVDLEAYFKAEDPLLQVAAPRLCDAVATLLSHTSKACLEAFLDPGVEEFVYRREVERSKAGSILVVRRKGNSVVAGAYRNLGFSLRWTTYVKSSVSMTGMWHEQYATLKSGSTPIVNGVPLWDAFTPVDEEPSNAQPAKLETPSSSPRKIVLSSLKKKQHHDELSPENPKYMLYQSRFLAQYLLRDVWVRFDGCYDCRATWEADGEVSEVRLKKALVGFRDEDEDEDEE